MNKTIYPNIVRGGIAIPLDRRNYFLVKGKTHEQGGIDIGSNPKTGLEVEDGEIVKMGNDGVKVYSAVPMLAGKSPAERVLMGEDPNKVFAAQETFKKVNGLKDDGTKAQLGKQKTIVNMDNNPLVKMFRGTNNKPNNLIKTKQSNSKFAGLKTHDGRGYNSDYIDHIYDSLSKSNLNKMQQAVILSHIINESGGDPFALNKNSGKDYGLLQWVDRYTKTKETDPYKEIDNQLNYIYSTVNNLDDQVSWTHGGEGSGYSSLKDAYNDFTSDDLSTVNKGFSLGYVRPAGKHDSANNRFGLAQQIYDRIKRLGGDKPYTTKLNPKEEFEFRQWYKKLADKKGLNPNYDAEDHYYDYRGFWKNEDRNAILTDNPNAHFTDKYKKPGHPTFSNESIYSKGNTIGGNWVQDKNGNWLFNHSEYTKQYKNRTKDYLRGTGEGYIINGDTIIDKKRFGGEEKDKVSDRYIYNYPYTRYFLEDPLYTSEERKLARVNYEGKELAYEQYKTRAKRNAKIVDAIDNFTKNDSIVYTPLLNRLEKYMKSMYDKQNFTDTELDNIELASRMLYNLSLRRANPYNKNHKFVNNILTNLSDDEISKLLNIKYYGKDASLVEGIKSKPKGVSLTDMWKLKNIMDNEYFNDNFILKENKKRLGGERKKAEWGMKEGGAADIITDMIPIVGSAKEITRLVKNPSWEQAGWTLASIGADALGLGVARGLAKAAKATRVSKNYFKATKGVHKAVKLNPTIDKILFEGAMLQSPQIALEAAQHDNNKKQFGGNMKHKLIEVNIGGNSKLIRVPSRSSTGESERSEGRDKAELGINYGKLEPLNLKYIPITTPVAKINTPSTRIPTTPIPSIDKSGIWGDVIGVGSNIIGSLITRGINNKMINNLKAPTMPVLETARKLNTKYNINPQEEAIKENLAAYERQIAGNTGSSRIALARMNKGRNLATSQLVNLYGQKENIETQLRNQDAMNQQTVAARNIERINKHLTDVTNFDNKVTEMRADNNVATVQNINQGVQDLLARRDRRASFNKTLMAQTFANPNLPAELFYAAGIWDKNTYDMYRKQYAKKS